MSGLTAYAQARAQRDRIADAVRQDGRALEAARQSYTQGASDFLNVTSAEAALLAAQDRLAVSDTAIRTDLVALYKALGGGWQIADGPRIPSPSPLRDAGAAARP